MQPEAVRRIATSLLVPLLAVVLIDLITYRLAAPVLRPSGDSAPGLGHQVLENIGLFSFYLSSLLTAAVLALMVFHRRPGAELPIVVAGLVLAPLGLVAQLLGPAPELVEVALRSTYGIALIAVVFFYVRRPGDLGVRIGLVILTMPLLIHAVGAITLRLQGEEVLYTELPERLVGLGHWALIVSAAAAPYCFGPRPFAATALRPAPVFIAAFVGVIATITARLHFEASAMLAAYGLGVELGAGISDSKLALALLGLGTMSWTLVSCFLAPSRERRRIGVGLTLLLAAGYGFHWPMQYSLGIVGLLVVARAGQSVGEEEHTSSVAGYFRAPPIDPTIWQAYVERLVESLAQAQHEANAVTTRTDDGRRTVVHTAVDDQPLTLSVYLHDDAVVRVEILVGELGDGPPAWTLAARPDRRLGDPPAPPHLDAPIARADDPPFDQRFRIRDAGQWTSTLLDDELRARTTALVDGWIAFWPGHGLGFCVHPGRGAPLDHPIPITELAFRGGRTMPSVERLQALFRLLTDIARRGLPPQPSP